VTEQHPHLHLPHRMSQIVHRTRISLLLPRHHLLVVVIWRPRHLHQSLTKCRRAAGFLAPNEKAIKAGGAFGIVSLISVDFAARMLSPTHSLLRLSLDTPLSLDFLPRTPATSSSLWATCPARAIKCASTRQGGSRVLGGGNVHTRPEDRVLCVLLLSERGLFIRFR